MRASLSVPVLAVAVACLALPRAAAAQGGLAQNDLFQSNGVDVVFTYSDPSVAGEFYWKVYPNTTIANPAGGSEVSGWYVSLYDTDWSTTALFYDTLFARGMASTANPGSIEPDFSDPGSVLIAIGPSGFPSPCVISPSLCTGGCPTLGFLLGYQVGVEFGTCAGDGIPFLADGVEHFTETSFIPPGMTLSGGSCGSGDYSLMDEHSTDEAQFDFLGTGYSAWGGFQTGGSSAPTAEPLTEIAAQHIELCGPVLNVRLGPPSALPIAYGSGQGETGTAGVHAPIAVAATGFGYRLYDLAQLASTPPFAFAASSVNPPFPAPGIPFLGGTSMIDFGDPTTERSLRVGSVLLDFQGGSFFDNGVFESANPMTIPPSAAGLSVWSQAFSVAIAPAGGIAVVPSNVVKTTFH